MARVQRGQAIVIVALILAVLCGMVGLAIDGGRAFVDRRSIQNAADAAALSGATTYLRTSSFSTAEQSLLDTYARNRALTYTLASACDKGWQAPPSGGSVTLNCTFNNDSSQSLSFTVTDFAPPASFEEFSATGSQTLLTALIQIVGAARTFNVSGTGCAATWNSSSCAAIPPVVLGTSSLCGTGGNAVTFSGASGSTPGVVGNIASYGNVAGTGGQVAGDTSWTCGTTPTDTQLCYPGGAALPCASYTTSGFRTGKPPLYNIPAASGSGTVQTTSGLQVNLASGTYTSASANGGSGSASNTVYFGGSLAPYQNGCYFLPPGVYNFSGVSPYVGGGVFSNELRPPDEPDQTSSDHSTVMSSSRQFWGQNGAKCYGTFSVTAVLDSTGGLALPTGAYAFRITSVRTNDNGVVRESGPSACRTLNVSLPGQGVNVAVSNVPGAQDYNVYMSSPVLSLAAADGDLHAGTCQGKFYQVASIPVQNYVNETNLNTTGCPSTVVVSPATAVSSSCTLGASAQTDDLCVIDRAEKLLGVLASLPSGCTTVLQSIPNVQPQPALTCSAAAAVGLSLPLTCSWPGPTTFRELLAPAASNLPDQDPAVGNEVADWGACDQLQSSSYVAPDSCPNTYAGYNPAQWVTPGAVQLQTDAADCFTFASGGVPFLFSGYQYAWGLIMHTGAVTCAMDYLTPRVGGEFVGHYYGTKASVTVTATSANVPSQGPQAPTVYGCVIAYQPTINAGSGIAVYFVTPTPTISITGYGIPTGSGC